MDVHDLLSSSSNANLTCIKRYTLDIG